MFFRQFGKIGALAELTDDVFGFFFRLHKNVRGAHFVAHRRGGDFGVVTRPNGLVGHRAGNLVLDEFAVQCALAQKRHAALKLRIVRHTGLHRSGGSQFDFDDRRDRGGAPLICRKLIELRVEVTFGKRDVGFGDVFAIHGCYDRAILRPHCSGN